MNIKAFLVLVLCNVFWSTAYSISKNLMTDFHPMEIAFLRHSTALLPLFLFGFRRNFPLISWVRNFRVIDLRILLVGVLTFFISPIFQMNGVNLSRAIDSSLMIAIEPLITILAACLMLRERPHRLFGFSVVLAFIGVAIVTELTIEKLLSFKDARLIGNLIMLGSLVCETVYSTVVKPVLKQRTGVDIMTGALLIGVVLLGIYNIVADGPERLGGYAVLLHSKNWVHWASVLFLGWGCTLFAYFAWIVVLEKATSVSAMAMTLYVQPVLGSFWGSWLLGEKINQYTIVGGALILFAVWLGSHSERKC